MFFAISTIADPRFPHHDTLGDLVFSHDAGWTCVDGSWFKGYREKDQGGNWCCVSYQGGWALLDHGKYRSFPLWWDPDTKTITNLLGHGERIWADCKIRFNGTDIAVDKVDPIGRVPDEIISKATAIDLVCERLIAKTKNLVDNFSTWDKKLFLTGGIDTLTLYSLVTSLSLDVEIVDYEYVKYDWFLNNNFQEIKKNHWAYQQIHHWQDPTVLITGGCGDEFMFRGPTTIALWAAWHDINLEELLEKSQGYHVRYFKKENNLRTFREHWKKRKEIRVMYPGREDLIKQILNINVNDHQHWHLGNTLTWTPFLDLEFTKIILSMDIDDVLDQIIDADLSKSVISNLSPEKLKLLSDSKNFEMRKKLNWITEIRA